VHYLDAKTWRPLCGASGVREEPRHRPGGGARPSERPQGKWTFVKASVTCRNCLRVLGKDGHGRGS
jgi:hypothetical protein